MTGAEGTYAGLPGTFPYAFRHTESWLFRSYVVVGGLLALALGVAWTLALVALIGQTASAGGGTFTLMRGFYVVVGLFVLVPLLAPVLLVARRHRRVGDADGYEDAEPAATGYDAGLAAAGYGYVVALYAGLVASVPPTFVLDGESVRRSSPTGPLAPVVEALYAVPQEFAVAFPLAAAALLWVVHRRLG